MLASNLFGTSFAKDLTIEFENLQMNSSRWVVGANLRVHPATHHKLAVLDLQVRTTAAGLQASQCLPP